MSDPEQPGEDLLDLAYPYALDALTPDERRAIEERLETASATTATEFARTVYGVRETLVSMTAFDTLNPPPSVEAAIQRALDESSGVSDRPRWISRTRLVRREYRVRWLATITAVVLAACVGTAAVADRSGEHPAQKLTAELVLEQPDTRATSVLVPGGGMVTVNTSPRLGAAAVTFAEVSAPPPGYAYQLWLVAPSGTVRPGPALPEVPTTGGPVMTEFDPSEALALTVEPEGGSSQPTSRPVVKVNLG
ncbi:anti-sigma factor [Nocardia australiensis]|uniref:anti-sigma factor n=1 Tax=Nocardia australiensis TaxID=2887191 RepID=UPI001D15999D|nr:anti-sigma factor [Nocardia australiensis]